MSLVEETRNALLEMFPEQAAAEEAKRVAAEAEQIAAQNEAQLEPDEETVATKEDEASVAKDEAAAEIVEEESFSWGVIDCDYSASGVHLDVLAPSSQIVQAAQILKDAGFFLESITGVDWIKEDEIEVIYDYNTFDKDSCRVSVRARIPRSAPVISSLIDLFAGANWHERETHDFFGIKFEGHPYLIPLLLPEDADFHPLLKDFTP